MYKIALIDEIEKTADGINKFIDIPQIGLPEEIEMTVKANNEDESVLNIGDVTSPGTPGLRKYTIECTFPQTGAPYPPVHYLNFLRSALEKKKVLRLVITRTTLQAESIYDTNMTCIIEDYSVKEEHGMIGDQFVTLKLKEFRAHGAIRMTAEEYERRQKTQAMFDKIADAVANGNISGNGGILGVLKL